MIDTKFLNSPYLDYANQELNWLPADTEQLYKKNLRKKREILEKYGWIDRSFTYKFNSHGFRCEEFDNSQDSVIFLGCSITIGIGLPYEKTWAYRVAKHLRLRNYNLGIGGSGLDTSFRMAFRYIPFLKPKKVILLEPPPYRFELFSKDSVTFYGSWDPSSQFKAFMANEANYALNREKNLIAISHICLENNIDFHHFRVDDLNMSKEDYARDLMHFGIRYNKELAIKITNMLQG